MKPNILKQMKYVQVQVTFAEVPDESTLCINISNCPFKCQGCHSTYLRDDIGHKLDTDAVEQMITDHDGITCICFMGGDSFQTGVAQLAKYVRKNHPELKTAWYSGDNEFPDVDMAACFDYVKVGPYMQSKGPLTSMATNQRMYKIHVSDEGEVASEDITDKFWL